MPWFQQEKNYVIYDTLLWRDWLIQIFELIIIGTV